MRLLPSVMLVALSSCGGQPGPILHFLDGGDPDPAADLSMKGPPPADLGGPPPPDLSPPPYPAGPYGTDVGNILDDFTVRGYALSPQQTDSTQLAFASLTAGAMHRDRACKCILLTMSAPWCAPCRDEQSHITATAKKDASFCIFEILVDSSYQDGNPQRRDLDAWTQEFRQAFPVGILDRVAEAKLPLVTALPTNVVIRPSTMEILDISTGFDPYNGVSDAKALCGN